MTTNVAVREGQAPVPAREPQAITVTPQGAESVMAIISRAASDPATDVDKLERLLGMYERIKANEARASYMEALSRMQPKLPIIDRKGKIVIREKVNGERTGAVQQATPYALWEDINEAITPILADHGFALSFRTGAAADGKITVTGILSHSAGHQEDTTITLMHDSTGSKNSVQAVGSSISYGKRYTATLLLNITSRGEDDDGKAGGAGELITEEQVKMLQSAIIEADADLPKFLKYLSIEKLADLPAAKYQSAMQALTAKQRAAKK